MSEGLIVELDGMTVELSWT